MPTKDEVIEALRAVEDPELGMDIVDLGLLYDVELENGNVKVIHTLTSMGCPVGPMIQEDIQNVAAAVPGVVAREDVGRREVHSRIWLGASPSPGPAVPARRRRAARWRRSSACRSSSSMRCSINRGGARRRS